MGFVFPEILQGLQGVPTGQRDGFVQVEEAQAAQGELDSQMKLAVAGCRVKRDVGKAHTLTGAEGLEIKPLLKRALKVKLKIWHLWKGKSPGGGILYLIRLVTTLRESVEASIARWRNEGAIPSSNHSAVKVSAIVGVTVVM